MRPSSLILGKDSRRPWGKWDLLLAEAYQILQDERCPQCGLPRYICNNDSQDVQFRIVEEQCVALVKRDEYEAKKYGKDTPKPNGTVLRPQPYIVNDAYELAELREPYYKAQYAKAEPDLPTP